MTKQPFKGDRDEHYHISHQTAPEALIDAPLQENSGWHGYAMPRFPAGRSPLANTLILGLLLAG